MATNDERKQSRTERDLAARFVEEARDIALGGRERFAIAADDIVCIARDGALRSQFIRAYSTDINDPDVRGILCRHLKDLAENQEETAAYIDNRVDLIDRAALAPAAAVTVAAIGLTIGSAGALGPLLLLGAGLATLMLSAYGRIARKDSGLEAAFDARKLRSLLDDLKDLEARLGKERSP